MHNASCSHCKASFRFPSEKGGELVNCPKCKEVTQLPFTGSLDGKDFDVTTKETPDFKRIKRGSRNRSKKANTEVSNGLEIILILLSLFIPLFGWGFGAIFWINDKPKIGKLMVSIGIGSFVIAVILLTFVTAFA